MKLSEILFAEVYEENQRHFDQLKSNLKRDKSSERWILCLGAGISISAGLPSWFQLLAEITAQVIPFESNYLNMKKDIQDGKEDIDNVDSYFYAVKNFYKNLRNDRAFYQSAEKALEGRYTKVFEKMNTLESAEYIRNFLEKEILGKEIRKNKSDLSEKESAEIDWYIKYFIAQVFQHRMEEKILSDAEESASGVPQKTSTLEAVANLMKSRIHNALTYNYDNLREHHLRENCKCDAKSVHSLVQEDPHRDFAGNDEWNIYHVHGRIPVFSDEEPSRKVILTESDYYQEEQVNYGWLNILQTYAMISSNVIFIGFSGADYNFRRIVKYFNQEEKRNRGKNKHSKYIFFSVDDIVSAVFPRIKESREAAENCIAEMNKPDSKYAYEKLLMNHLIHAQTRYWKDHGLEVIWSSHEELPAMINDLC